MNHFTSTATKDGRWWVVQCDQEPGALSQVARLDQAEEHQREAISMITDLDEADIEVTVVPKLDETVTVMLDQVRATRAEAEQLQREAAEAFASVAAQLREDGLSLRDVGTVLGVSHQRVAQLVGEPKQEAKGPASIVEIREAQRRLNAALSDARRTVEMIRKSSDGLIAARDSGSGGRIAARDSKSRVVGVKKDSARTKA